MKTLALFCLLALPALAADTTIVGKVVGVHDGDTLTLRTEDETLKVRLSGIDTPELGQPLLLLTPSRHSRPLPLERLPPSRAVAKTAMAGRWATYSLKIRPSIP